MMKRLWTSETCCGFRSAKSLNTAALSCSQLKVIFVQGRLCCLDVGPDSVLHYDLIMDGLQDVRTVLESDFGTSVIDVNYFASLHCPSTAETVLVLKRPRTPATIIFTL